MCGEVRSEKLQGAGEGETMIQYYMQRNVLNEKQIRLLAVLLEKPTDRMSDVPSRDNKKS